jgi:hypothetical protein
MTEHHFVRSVHSRLKKQYPSLYVWKINDAYQGGVADAYYSGPSDLWVEYKYVKALPKRDNTLVDVGLSDLQKIWLRARHTEGRNVCVVVGSPEGTLILPGIEWDKSISRAQFISSAVDKSEVVAYIGMQVRL